MQVHQGWLQIACWLFPVCLGAILLDMRGNQLLCCGLQISTQKLYCMWLVLISICLLCNLHFSHKEILPVVCGHCVLLFQLPEGNSSISSLCNIHHRLLVLWCSISIKCQLKCVKGKLLVILFYHVLEIAVLHRHHLMHLYKPCNISLDWDSVILMLGWLIPWVLKKHCDGLVSTQMLLPDELIVSKAWLFLQTSWWIFYSIPWVQGMHILVWASLVDACFWLLAFLMVVVWYLWCYEYIPNTGFPLWKSDIC